MLFKIMIIYAAPSVRYWFRHFSSGAARGYAILAVQELGWILIISIEMCSSRAESASYISPGHRPGSEPQPITARW